MDARDLARLAHLVEARKAGALARLEALTAEMRTCEDEIVALRETAARDLAEGGLPPAQQALRLKWAEQGIVLARQRIARLAPEIAAARAAAIRELGKHEALETLSERAEVEATRLRAARVERDAPPHPARPK
ncbi:MAG: hypothetical protein U1E34_03190 [Amaricoccus sp.]